MGTLRREGPINARPRPRPALSPGARGAAHARCGARPPPAPVRLRPGHSGRLVVGSGPAAPHRSLLSAQTADSSPPGFSGGEGCTPCAPFSKCHSPAGSQRVGGAVGIRTRVVAGRLPVPCGEPSAVPDRRRLAAPRGVSLSCDTLTHFITRTPGPENGERSYAEVTPEISDRAPAPTCWLSPVSSSKTLSTPGQPARGFF